MLYHDKTNDMFLVIEKSKIVTCMLFTFDFFLADVVYCTQKDFKCNREKTVPFFHWNSFEEINDINFENKLKENAEWGMTI